jgi:hypothetical protein
VTSPEGEAYVYYAIRPRQNLPSGTFISSQAAIYFDSNPPILTNNWWNRTDEDPPISSMSANLGNDSIISLILNGTDAVSGVESYRIFVSKDGGPFTSLFTFDNQSRILTGSPGHSYAFYCEATDSAGNREDKVPMAEASIDVPLSIGELEEEMAVFHIMPNPNNGSFGIRAAARLQDARLEVLSMEGKVLFSNSYTAEAREMIPVSMESLSSGMYFVSLSTAKGVYRAQRLLIVK